jgi:hypothetical protein
MTDYCAGGSRQSYNQVGDCACDSGDGVCKLNGTQCMVVDPSAGR